MFFKRPKNLKKLIIEILKYSLFAFLCGLALLLFLFIYYGKDLPQPEKFTEKPFIQSTKIYDRTGKILLYDIYGEERREVVSLNQISINLKDAIIATEDVRFYQHHGVDFMGIVRAILTDLKLRSPSQGASTISQQLIRSSFLTTKKTIDRKIKEIILTLELENKYSKDQIFEWYLNQIPLGENCYGVEAAAQTYFKKSSADVSITEAATLTALIAAPSYYSPYGPHQDKLLQRKDLVLSRMKKAGYINEDQYQAALKEEIVFADNSKAIKAPHFVFYIKEYLEQKYGVDYLKESGFKVYTSLDYDLQKFVEDTVSQKMEQYLSFNVNNAAVTVINPKTGEILALVGSKNYFADSYPEGCNSEQGECLFDPRFDVATLGERQPGSSFKPFVYATAFKEGYSPNTLLWDVATEFNPTCNPDGTQTTDPTGGECYSPHDFDEQTRGLVSLRQALAQSLNIPSVKTLYLAGVNNSLKTAKDLGLTTLTDPSRYGLSLVLGGGEVNLLEMTSAYGVFANDGLKIPPVSILKIEGPDGNIIEENKTSPERVLSSQVARLVNNVLSDNDARVPVFVRNNALYFEGYQVAAKTGTTSSYKDVWTMGYTPYAVVGVWAGNNNSQPIDRKTGIGVAAPIWRIIMEKILREHPVENFIDPSPVETPDKPMLNGTTVPNEYHTILQYIDKNNLSGDTPIDPSVDVQYASWEWGVQNWLKTHPQ